ncbi:hypothetical protein ACX0G7_26880 [Flavitalea antarctica]
MSKLLEFRVREKRTISNFYIRYFQELAEHLLLIAVQDAKLAGNIYETLYHHKEESRKETYLGSAAMMLTSNRQQDYHIVQYRLEKSFSQLLTIGPAMAIKIAITITDPYLKQKKGFSFLNNSFDCSFLGHKSKLVPDYLGTSSLDTDHGPECHLTTVEAFLESLAKEKNWNDLTRLLVLIAKTASASGWWNLLLRLCQKHPLELLTITRELLQNGSLYLCSSTQFHASELLKSGFAVLSQEDQVNIEKLLLDLERDDKGEYGSLEWIEGIKRKMIGCIPRERLQLNETKSLIDGLGELVNERPQSGVRIITERDSVMVDEAMLGRDLNPHIPADVDTYGKLCQLEKANNHLPTLKEIDEAEWKLIIDLFEIASISPQGKKHFRHICDVEIIKKLIQFSAVVAVRPEQRLFMNEMAANMLGNPSYIPTDFRAAKSQYFLRQSEPRYDAVIVLRNNLVHSRDKKILKMLLRHAVDNDSAVRYCVIECLQAAWAMLEFRDDFWAIMYSRFQTELDGNCLISLLHNITFDDIIEEDSDRVHKALEVANTRLATFIEDSKVVDSFALTVLKLWRKGHEFTKNILDTNLKYYPFRRMVLVQVIRWLDPQHKQLLRRQSSSA